MIFLSILLAAMTSEHALVTLLNSPTSTSPRLYAEAESIVLREAKEGKVLQQFVIGVTTKDKALAETYLDRSRARIEALAKKTNNSLAWYLVSLDKNDMTALKKAVEGGNVQALNAYGTLLVQAATSAREGASTNVQMKAVRRGYDCFRQAATKGDPNGFVNLGTCYLRGLGCPPNPVLAHECFMSAARAGHPEGMDYVAADYQLGVGVEKNERLSLVWTMKARAYRGDKAAAAWLRTGKRE